MQQRSRTESVEFRVTPDELHLVQRAARAAQARSVSDFVRAIVLREVGQLAVDPALQRVRQQAAERATVNVLQRALVTASDGG